MNASGMTFTGASGNGANGGVANNGFGDGLPGGNGQSGGAIYNEGSLALTGCIVTSVSNRQWRQRRQQWTGWQPASRRRRGSGGLGGGIYLSVI
jgi:hypothetical protein